MFVQDLIDQFRLDAGDSLQPYLWTDDELTSYANSAQRKLVRGIKGILDSTTPELTTYAITAGTQAIARDPRVLRIESAWLTTAQRYLRIDPEDRIRPWDTTPGDPWMLITDADDKQLLLDCVPASADTLQLKIRRMPLAQLTGAGQVCEVDDIHFDGMLVGMKALAYSKHDAETFDQNKSQDYAAQFEQYIKLAHDEMHMRREPVRTTGYGGVRANKSVRAASGFSPFRSIDNDPNY